MHWGLSVGLPWLPGCDWNEEERVRKGESRSHPLLKVGIPEAAAV